MYCNKCGKKIEENSKVCKNCGNILEVGPIIHEEKKYEEKKERKTSKYSDLKFLLLGSGLGLIIVMIMFSAITQNTSIGKYYFSNDNAKISQKHEEQEDPEEPDNIEENQDDKKTKKSKNKTEVENDKTYGISYTGELTEEDAKEIIIKDSERQKTDNTPEITEVENKFINKYNIVAANLLEMDPEFADDLTEVFKTIYKEYPEMKKYLTNITLYNTSVKDAGLIAAYQPIAPFAYSDTESELPAVSKMSILLSAKYFLNPKKLEKSVKASEKAGWFPENCSKYSPVAHELGHYLSFIALKKEYGLDSTLIITEDNYMQILEIIEDFSNGDFSKSIIEEAYENYKKENDTTESFDEWRGNISEYALAKDNEGNYIYDETIAEAFHDIYLNGNNANEESKYIVDVLKEKIGE